MRYCIFFQTNWLFRKRVALNMLTKLTWQREGGLGKCWHGWQRGEGGWANTDIDWQRGRSGLDPPFLADIICKQPLRAPVLLRCRELFVFSQTYVSWKQYVGLTWHMATGQIAEQSVIIATVWDNWHLYLLQTTTNERKAHIVLTAPIWLNLGLYNCAQCLTPILHLDICIEWVY